MAVNKAAAVSKRVEHCVEQVCRKGCRAVWADIDALEQGRHLEETRHLSGAEAHAVLQELKAIMAVYEGSCSPA